MPISKCLVLFVEGDTEVGFYKQVVANARKLHPAGRFDTNIESGNLLCVCRVFIYSFLVI